jgi:hypothetical protein
VSRTADRQPSHPIKASPSTTIPLTKCAATPLSALHKAAENMSEMNAIRIVGEHSRLRSIMKVRAMNVEMGLHRILTCSNGQPVDDE